MKEYIKESSKKIQSKKKEYFLFNKILVLVQDNFYEDIDLNKVLSNIEKTIPEKWVYELDSIYIGNFKELNNRQIESLYLDGAILISNSINSEELLFKTLIHEIAHNVEKVYAEKIYSDGKLQDEFLTKRKKLYNDLKKEGFDVNLPMFLNIDYSKEFDEFLYNDVGYERLSLMSHVYFVSGPYSSTSIREYFASGVEYFCTEADLSYLSAICPKLYSIIKSLTKK